MLHNESCYGECKRDFLGSAKEDWSFFKMFVNETIKTNLFGFEFYLISFCMSEILDLFHVNREFLDFNLYLYVANFLNFLNSFDLATLRHVDTMVPDFDLINKLERILSFNDSIVDVNVGFSCYNIRKFFEVAITKNLILMVVTRALSWFFCF